MFKEPKPGSINQRPSGLNYDEIEEERNCQKT